MKFTIDDINNIDKNHKLEPAFANSLLDGLNSESGRKAFIDMVREKKHDIRREEKRERQRKLREKHYNITKSPEEKSSDTVNELSNGADKQIQSTQ